MNERERSAEYEQRRCGHCAIFEGNNRSFKIQCPRALRIQFANKNAFSRARITSDGFKHVHERGMRGSRWSGRENQQRGWLDKMPAKPGQQRSLVNRQRFCAVKMPAGSLLRGAAGVEDLRAFTSGQTSQVELLASRGGCSGMTR